MELVTIKTNAVKVNLTCKVTNFDWKVCTMTQFNSNDEQNKQTHWRSLDDLEKLS